MPMPCHAAWRWSRGAVETSRIWVEAEAVSNSEGQQASSSAGRRSRRPWPLLAHRSLQLPHAQRLLWPPANSPKQLPAAAARCVRPAHSPHRPPPVPVHVHAAARTMEQSHRCPKSWNVKREYFSLHQPAKTTLETQFYKFTTMPLNR